MPPDPPLRYDEKLQFLLSEADRALARLEGVATVLSNRDLFVAIFAKKKALLSSQRYRKYLFVDYIDIIARGTEI